MVMRVIPSHQRAAFGAFSLTGDAEAYFNEHASGMSLADMSWETFSSILKSAYASPQFSIAAKTALFKLQQDAMTVLELRRKLETLVSQVEEAGIEKVTEHDKVFYFQRALRPALAETCVLKSDGSEWATLAELSDYVNRREALTVNLKVQVCCTQKVVPLPPLAPPPT